VVQRFDCCSSRPILVLALLAAGVGCSGRPVLEGPAPEFAPPPSAPAAAVAKPASRGTLYRDDVLAVIDRGFPRFLQMVDVEAKLWDGKFVGWRILALRPVDFWESVDLRVGDVVTRVNELPIERDTEAFAAFQSLKAAPRLVVSFEREGQPRTLDFQIVNRPGGVAAR